MGIVPSTGTPPNTTGKATGITGNVTSDFVPHGNGRDFSIVVFNETRDANVIGDRRTLTCCCDGHGYAHPGIVVRTCKMISDVIGIYKIEILE